MFIFDNESRKNLKDYIEMLNLIELSNDANSDTFTSLKKKIINDIREIDFNTTVKFKRIINKENEVAGPRQRITQRTKQNNNNKGE